MILKMKLFLVEKINLKNIIADEEHLMVVVKKY
jgi:hypothetical protein